MRFFYQWARCAFIVGLCVLGAAQLRATSEVSDLTQRMAQMRYPDALQECLEKFYPEDRQKVLALFSQAPEVETVLLERAGSIFGRIGQSLGTTGRLLLGTYFYDPRHETRLLLQIARMPGFFEGDGRPFAKYARELFQMPEEKASIVLAYPTYFQDVLWSEPWLIQGICNGLSLQQLRMSAEAGEKGAFRTHLVSYYGKESNKYLGPMIGTFCFMMFVALVVCSGDDYKVIAVDRGDY